MKHGFYAHCLPRAGQERLAKARTISPDDLTEEIATTRDRLAAVLKAKPENFDLWCTVLRTLARTAAVQFAMRPTAAMRLEEATDNVIDDLRKLIIIKELDETED